MNDQQLAAVKQALEALEGVLDDAPKVLDASISGGLYEVVQCRDAITAIKQAIAQDALDKKADNARELGLDYEPAAVQEGRDWSLLEATQESLREHMAEINRLQNEIIEQCRINGMSAEREDALRAEIKRLKAAQPGVKEG
jgi:hypothetical protein